MTENISFSIPTSFPDGAETISVSPSELPDVLDLLELSFPALSRSFFYSLITRDPSFQPRYSIAVKMKNRFVSFVQVFLRTLVLDTISLSVGGIGCVATHPDFRNRRFASALLHVACELLNKEKIPCAILYTSIHPFYEKNGFQMIRQRQTDFSLPGLEPATTQADWSKSAHHNDYATLHAIYERMQHQMKGGIRRSLAYWQARESWLSHFSALVFDQDKIVGYFYYAQYDLQKPVLDITEFGYLENDPKILDRLFRLMCKKAKDLHCKVLRGFFKQDKKFYDFVKTLQVNIKEFDFLYVMGKDTGSKGVLKQLQNHTSKTHLLSWTTDAF